MSVTSPENCKRLSALGLLLAARRASGTQRNRSDEGLSLLECLMAVAVIALTAAIITPPLFIAAASRVQNRRAEQALQLAQGEIDRIQVLVNQSEHIPTRLPSTVAVTAGNTNLNSAAPLPSVASAELRSINPGCNTYNDQQLPVTTALRVDTTGDCQPDFLLQMFRSDGSVSSGERAAGGQLRPTDFQLGVRVYSILANGNWGGLQRDQASLQITSGQGSQRTRPLAVLTTNVVWSDRAFSLCDYQTAGVCPH